MGKELGPESWLELEFDRRCNANPAYSLRAFAKSLGLSPGRLSEYFSGKRAITPAAAERISVKLNHSPQKRLLFIGACSNSISGTSDADFENLDEEKFKTIADTQHFTILNLLLTANFKSDLKWIAQRVGLSTTTVRAALKRLERLELISADENGNYSRSSQSLRVPDGIASAALKESHRQSLQAAIRAIDEVPKELRDISSTTMAINPSRLPEAKRRIQIFRRQLAKFLEQGRRTEVYDLNIQLVPATRASQQKGRKS